MEATVSQQRVAITWLAGLLGVAAVLTSFGQRNADSPAVAVWLAVAATIAALVAAALGVVAARRAYGLALPETATDSWPEAPWWWVVGAAGVADVLVGASVNGWVGVGGAVLFAVACLGFGRDLTSPPREIDRGVVAAARRLAAVKSGTAPGSRDSTSNSTTGVSDSVADAATAAAPSAAVTRVGAVGARVVIFDASGRLGDVVVSDVQRGELAAQLAGLPLVPAEQLHPPLRTN